MIQLELTFFPLSLQDPPFYRCTREAHDTHPHDKHREHLFLFFLLPRDATLSLSLSLPVLLFSPSLDVTFPSFLFSFFLPKTLFQVARETEQRAQLY